MEPFYFVVVNSSSIKRCCVAHCNCISLLIFVRSAFPLRSLRYNNAENTEDTQSSQSKRGSLS